MSQQQNPEPSSDGANPPHSDPPASEGGDQIPPKPRPDERRLTIAICFFLVLAVWAVFGRTIRYEFVNYDDQTYVCGNPAMTGGVSLSGIARLFMHASGPSEWVPLTAVSHMLDWQLYGANAGGHHLTSVLLHAATVILLFLVLRQLTGAVWRSAFVAAVFAIHPLRVESVAWVTERKDVLSGLFFMLTLMAYTRYAQNVAGDKWQVTKGKPAAASSVTRHPSLFYWLSLFCFALGLLSKSMLVTLPFVLLLLDYWPLKRIADFRFPVSGLKWILLEKIPFLLLSAAACAATVLVQEPQKQALLTGVTFPWRVANTFVSYAAYLWQMFYPAGLAVLYPHPGNHLAAWKIVLSVLVLLAISAGVMVGARKRPYLAVGWLWYLGMLVPVIGLIQVGYQARADRYTYLPQIGLYILLTWGVVELCGTWRHRRVVLGTAAGVVLAGLLAGAINQTEHWKNSISLWTHTLAGTTDNFVGENSFGSALAARGQWDEAVQHYERALQIKPDYTDAHIALGNALASQGKFDDAIQHYERALQIKPDYAEVRLNWGSALAGQGKLAEAIRQYELLIQLKPDFVQAYMNLAGVLAKQGKASAAIQQYERALQIKPDFASAHINLGIALAGQGRMDEALQHFERAVRLEPDNAEAQNDLAVALAGQGKADEALPHFQQGLALATAQGKAALAQAIRSRLQAYPQTWLPPQIPMQ